jgi:hypothetical protein
MMEFSELKQKLDVYEKLKQQAIVEFVMSHCTVKIGDIAESSQHNISVSKISVTMRNGKPNAVLSGVILKKDWTPRKDKQIGYVFLPSPCKEGEYL